MRRPIRVLTLAGAAPLVVLALAACTQPAPLPTLITRTPTASASAEPRLPIEQIAALAEREVGEGTVVEIDDESDGREWDVRVVLEDGAVREVHLDGDGTVLAGPSADATDADEQSDNRALVAAASVGLEAAAKRMAGAVSRGRVTAIELDDWQDRVVWRGDVLDGDGVRHDVRIDAVNRSVVLNQADAPATPPTGS